MNGILSSIIRKIGKWIKDGLHKVVNAMRGFFVEIVSWVDRVYDALLRKINHAIDCTQFYLKKIAGKLVRGSYNYIQQPNNQWERYKVEETKNVDESEVPLEFRQKAQNMMDNGELDITENVRNELNLCM